MEVHREYYLRRKKNQDAPKKNQIDTVVRKTPERIPRKTTENVNNIVKKIDPDKGKIDQKNNDPSFPSTSTSDPDKTILSRPPNQNQQIKNVEKFMADKTDISFSKTQVPFSFEGDIAKIKITVPLTKLVTQEVYRSQDLRVLNMGNDTNTLNLTDDKPELLFGPELDRKHQEGAIPPFYVSLNIHDKILHNAMLDSSASHNLMPKVVMDRLGLEITRPYKQFYSFDSRRFKCLGLIKDLCVNLAQIPAKNLVMDIMVADIPPKYGMLLSRSWGAKLQGNLQLDTSYATIPIFNQTRRLY